jgi:GTP-binding protein YchF
MRVAFVGPAQSGKSSLFSAVAGPQSGADAMRPDQAHVAVVKVPDERLDWLAELYNPKKFTPAELEFVDLPGLDLSDEAGRARAKTHWSTIRQSDMLLYVVRAFEDASVAPYRDRVDPVGDVGELRGEMLFADLEQVANRIEKLEGAIKKPTPKRDEQVKELALMQRIHEALENEESVASQITNETEAKLVRSFAFLSALPAMVAVNCGEDQLSGGAETVDSLPAMYLSAKIEQEMAELDPEEREMFLTDLGLTEAARDRLVRACYARMDLISFLTVGEDECRAWTIPAGTDAVTAAEEIHSDIARGFIRAETVAYDDLREAGDMKAVKAAGKMRLEGKHYVVQDGDVINFRFNV